MISSKTLCCSCLRRALTLASVRRKAYRMYSIFPFRHSQMLCPVISCLCRNDAKVGEEIRELLSTGGVHTMCNCGV